MWALGKSWRCWPGPGSQLAPWAPPPPGALGQVVPGPVHAEMHPFPPAGAAPHAPGMGGPSVTPGTPRACLPEPAQDLGSEHISCAHTLPTPDPVGRSPALSAPSGTCCPADAPSPLPAPARGHLLPAIHSPGSCPPMTTGRPALSSSWSLLRALSTGVCLWGWGEPEPTWRVGSVRKRGRDSPRCPEQGLGRGWTATRGRECRAPASPPAAAWSPPVPRAPR